MASYVVFEPPRGGAGPAYVRDSFRWPAFLLPWLWLLWHRLWIEALIVLAAMLGLGALGERGGLSFATPWLSLLLSLLIGFEAAALRIRALRRRGWREWGVVEAATVDDAETRYLAETGQAALPPPPEPSGQRPAAPRPLPSGPALGLLHYPGGR
jgi:hypothetical protein